MEVSGVRNLLQCNNVMRVQPIEPMRVIRRARLVVVRQSSVGQSVEVTVSRLQPQTVIRRVEWTFY